MYNMLLIVDIVIHVLQILFQVHVLNQACGSRSRTCTCAAMVKSEDDVLVVDVCNKVGGSPGEQPVRLYRNGNLTEGTKIYQDNDGKLITVSLAVKVTIVSMYKD